MGFRTGAYAKVWEVSPMSDTSTKIRISVSRKISRPESMNKIFLVLFCVSVLLRQRRHLCCMKVLVSRSATVMLQPNMMRRKRLHTQTSSSFLSRMQMVTPHPQIPLSRSDLLMMVKLTTAACRSD